MAHSFFTGNNVKSPFNLAQKSVKPLGKKKSTKPFSHSHQYCHFLSPYKHIPLVLQRTPQENTNTNQTLLHKPDH